MTEKEAIQAITAKVSARYQTGLEEDILFYTERAVNDVLAYCHRSDFPDRLVYAVAEMIVQLIDAQYKRQAMAEEGVPGPLKALEQNETKFEFAVVAESVEETSFETHIRRLYPLLNKYRRIYYR